MHSWECVTHVSHTFHRISTLFLAVFHRFDAETFPHTCAFDSGPSTWPNDDSTLDNESLDWELTRSAGEEGGREGGPDRPLGRWLAARVIR